MQNSEKPVLSFSSDTTVISEGGEAQLTTFNLSQPAPTGGLPIKLRIDDPDGEPGDTDNALELFSNVTDFGDAIENGVFVANITIAEGATQATIGIKALADNQVEGDETYSLTLLENENYTIDPTSTTITTTIKETMNLPTVSVTAEPTIFAENGGVAEFIFTLSKPAPQEGLQIKFEAFDEDGMGGDSEVSLENISDIQIETGSNASSFIKVEPGATEAKVIITGIPDDVPEGEEAATFTLLEGEGYTIDSQVNSATLAITDLPIVSVFAEPTEVEEGSQLLWNFDLTGSVPAGGLAVDLDLVEDTDPLPGDITYFVDGSENITDFELVIDESTGLIEKAVVTLAEGATSATLVSDIIADNATEGPESVSFALAEVEGYSIDSDVNAASFTILDTSTSEPTISVFAEPTEVEEGSQLLWNFSLTEAVPAGGLAVDLDLVEDTDPLPGDITYFVEGSENITDFELVIDESTGLIDKAVVTLAPGATSATLVSDIIADNATEGPESVSFALAEVEGYSIDSDVNAASFTILDTSIATGDETIVGDESDEVLDGQDGDDLIAGGLGNDEILGGDGDDVLRGDLNSRSPGRTVGGDDTISGGAGDDRIGGKAGDDQLFGDEGDDQIWGDDGDDLIRGGLGNDILVGDNFSGGSGADTFVLAAGEGTDTIVDFEVGTDIIGLADGLTAEDLSINQVGDDTEISFNGETLAIVFDVDATAFTGFEGIFTQLETYLNDNPTVFGSAVAFNPEIVNASPFVFRGSEGLERTDIADAIDYTTAIWYEVPVEQGEALWSEPYFDVGGAGEDIALTTYSIPLFNPDSSLVGVVTNDLLLGVFDTLQEDQDTIQAAVEEFAEVFEPDANDDGNFTSEDLDGIFTQLEDYLGENTNIFGSAFAFNPEVLNASPFVFQGEEGLEQTDIADAIDYTDAIWYEVPVEQGEALWSDPYFDVGGAGEDVLLTTYSVPLLGEDSSLIGVLTSDLLLATFDSGEIEAQQAAIRPMAEELSQTLILPDLDGGLFGSSDPFVSL